ncbi:DUF2218 domain-containing protein [Nocardioides yefusunii]|uniref:DUF2218 domain-containing protein n=1 Tax=Nocardioides yefusunii TaxID=2500546 RepID=A0ABW1QZV7_9ACTN|nr:DUF2218 domain-containing protein [Nocardioides yefusunii]
MSTPPAAEHTETLTVVGTVATDRGDRYVKQLGDHFGRKVEVVDSDAGRLVTFAAGTCLMSAAADRIVLTAVSSDDESLATVQDVVTRHLERFGARDELKVAWAS